jgi:K+-transporting ATPase ATPase C chain
MASLLRPALLLLATLGVLTGLAYPALVTGAMQALLPAQANGSLIREGDRVLGSSLIGQPFSDPGRFWGRPSATARVPYDAAASTGSNQGPSNPALQEAVKARIEALRAADPGNPAPVPADLVTASGSGLDPHVSPAAALYQVGRVARARGLPEDAVRRLVEARIEGRGLGLLGEPRVNVLLLNLDLERAAAGGS